MSRLIMFFLFAFSISSALAEEPDARQTVPLTEDQRNLVLTEMRHLLSGVETIIKAVAKNNMSAVADAASALGANMENHSEHTLHEVLPKEFMRLGMSMHQDFDKIAADAMALKDSRHTLAQLGETMSKCNSCHALYQIRASVTVSTP